MFRQKEFVEEAVRLQKALTVQAHGVALDREEAPVLECLERCGKTLRDLDPEFVLEITPAHVPQLKLQDKLANEALIRRGREGAINGKLSLFKARQIRLKVMLVLTMHAIDMPTHGHAQPEPVRSCAEPIAVNEFRWSRTFHGGVGTGHRIAGPLQFAETVIHPVPLRFPISHGRD